MDINNLDLDFALALRRFGRDIRDDWFKDALEYEDVLALTDDELALALEDYQPSAADSFDVPKRGLTLRPCLQMEPLDRIVYQALVDPLAEVIDPQLSERAFSHRLRAGRKKYMFRQSIEQWRLFNDRVAAAVAEEGEGKWVLATDVARYFSNINRRALARVMESLLDEAERADLKPLITALFQKLRVWSPSSQVGIPQNMEPSSFLGNVFLDILDRQMLGVGWRYYRYMDDIRVITDSEGSARLALKAIIGHLRKLDLGVNAAKTKIVRGWTEELWEVVDRPDPGLEEIEKLLKTRAATSIDAAVVLLIELASDVFDAQDLSERRLKFCLHRLVSVRRYVGVEVPEPEALTEYLLKLLPARPHLSDVIVKYLSTTSLDGTKEFLEDALDGGELFVYEWQNYLLWTLATQAELPSARLLRRAREIVAGAETQPERAGAGLYLGRMGDYADRATLRTAYRETLPAIEKRAVCVSVQESHVGDRQAFYRSRRSRGAGLIPRLAGYIESLDVVRYVPPLPPLDVEDIYNDAPSVLYG